MIGQVLQSLYSQPLHLNILYQTKYNLNIQWSNKFKYISFICKVLNTFLYLSVVLSLTHARTALSLIIMSVTQFSGEVKVVCHHFNFFQTVVSMPLKAPEFVPFQSVHF